MNRSNSPHSIFSEAPPQPSSWRSYITSAVAHVCVVIILFSLTFRFLQPAEKPRASSNITLIAPRFPDYQPKAVPRPHIKPPLVVAKVEHTPKTLPPVKPAQPKLVERPQIAAAPEIKVLTPAASRIVPEPKYEAPAPKPEVHTGQFETVDAAKAPVAPKVLKVGGFGDPNGLAPSTDSRAGVATLAKVGSFDMPAGSGNAGGAGHAATGSVRPTSFGNMTQGANGPGGDGHATAVRTGAFADSAAAASPSQNPSARAAEPASTPVEILSKPKPVYTQEARDLKLEGQVTLEVLFLANGSIRILRVLQGLGHGLDEAAEKAAMQVRFRPATRGRIPVDTNARINITFQLT